MIGLAREGTLDGKVRRVPHLLRCEAKASIDAVWVGL
jgi:hypothetical protein